MKPCEPQDVTAASTLRAIKITTQLPHVIVVNVAAREQGGWGRVGDGDGQRGGAECRMKGAAGW